MEEMIKELAKSVAETNRKTITAIFDDYSKYIDSLDIAYLVSKAFHEMIWEIEEQKEQKRRMKNVGIKCKVR